MLKKFILIFFLSFFITSVKSSTNQEIIENLKKISNFSFYFKQTIKNNTEKGSCIIEYPKKIYCQYDNVNKKIIVSNGKSLVIKNQINNQIYFYPLKQTPLNLLLDKEYLIKEFKKLKLRNINEKYLNFLINNKNNQINIFFDKKTLDLVGWQIEDMYQNLTIFFISNIKINQNIDKRIFILPNNN